jgi:hypothetical protein
MLKMKWKQYKNQNTIRSIDTHYSDGYFVSFNKIKVKDVLNYLNTHNIETQEEAWKYIDALTDSYKCSKCKKEIPCSVKEYDRGSWNKRCNTCIEKQKNNIERNEIIL